MSASDTDQPTPSEGDQWKDFRGEVGTVSVDGHRVTWTPNNEDAYDGSHPRTYWLSQFLDRGYKYVGPPTESGDQR